MAALNFINFDNSIEADCFYDWADEIQDYLKAIFGFDSCGKVGIEFSSEQPLSNYQVSNHIETIEERWQQLPEDVVETIKHICSSYQSRFSDDWQRLAAGAIAEVINEFVPERYEDLREELEQILNDSMVFSNPSRTFLLGEYSRRENRIILYSKNIEKSASFQKGKDVRDEFREVFAHEFFHFFHYESAAAKGNIEEIEKRSDYTSKVVKESMAAAFELVYCKRNGILTDIRKDWDNNSIMGYPYSGAKEIKSASLFKKIFVASLTDFDRALRILLRGKSNLFYRIKNIVKYMKTTPNVQKITSEKPRPYIDGRRKAGKRCVFMVCQTGSYDVESKNGYIWAPLKSHGTPDNSSHEELDYVKKGDIIFHHFKNRIHAVSIAKSDRVFFTSPGIPNRPRGRYVQLEYILLDNTVSTAAFNSLKAQYSWKYTPFTRSGHSKCGYYLSELPIQLALAFIEAAIAANPGNKNLVGIREYI